VAADRTVRGRAVGRLVSMPQCSFQPNYATTPQARNKSGDVSGNFDGRQFELQINMTSVDGATIGVDSLVGLPGRAPTVLAPVTGPGIAQGETVTTRTAGTVVGSGRQTVKLQCTGCK
jgi:hypothetical protein